MGAGSLVALAAFRVSRIATQGRTAVPRRCAEPKAIPLLKRGEAAIRNAGIKRDELTDR